MSNERPESKRIVGPGTPKESIFATRSIDDIYAEIAGLYKGDRRPWVIGFSGGKDSTVTLQLVWEALTRLPEAERIKPVHIISSDTLVESPIIARYIRGILDKINVSAKQQRMPMSAQMVYPRL